MKNGKKQINHINSSTVTGVTLDLGEVVINTIDHWEFKGSEDTYPMKQRWPSIVVKGLNKLTFAYSFDVSKFCTTLGGNKCEIRKFDGEIEVLDLHKEMHGMDEDVKTSLDIVCNNEDADKVSWFFYHNFLPKAMASKGKTLKLELHRYFDSEEDVNANKPARATLKVGRSTTEVSFTECKPVLTVA